MKTDRFDEEFRRKLQDLPGEATTGDVERTLAYVQANKPPAPGLGWGKLLLYGGSGLLLIGSLVYNGIQHRQTKQLHTSLDSLAHHSAVPATPANRIQHDTIYVTRTVEAETGGPLAEPTGVPITNAREAKPLTKSSVTPPSSNNQVDAVAANRWIESRNGRNADLLPTGVPASRSALRSDVPAGTPSVPSTAPGRKFTDSVYAATGMATPPDLPAYRAVKPSRPVADQEKTSSADGEVAEPTGLDKLATRLMSDARSTNRAKKRSGRVPDDLITANRLRKQTTRADQSPAIVPSVNPTTSSVSKPASERIQLADNVGLITIQQPVSTLTLPDLPASYHPVETQEKRVAVAMTKSTRRAWHLTLPHISVLNAQYRVGVSLTGGVDQLAGGLLGEVQLNPRWSMQGGMQVNTVDGFHYRDEAEFGRRRNKDFRQTYGVQETATTDIEDVRLTSTILQLPIQVAYHYPLGRQWGLRLGLGTELDLSVHSAIGYEYRDNNRATERKLAVANQPASLVNSATLSLALERVCKKWQFRAGPFISPQFRPVSYKPEDLIWGGNVKIFYRLRN